MNIAILPNLVKENSIDFTRIIIKKLQNLKAKVSLNLENRKYFTESNIFFYNNSESLVKACDIVITTGGDGTIIHNAKQAAFFNKPILGINLGRVGFTAGIEKNELEKLNFLINNNYTISRRCLISVEIEKRSKKKFLALNDINISRSDNSKICNFSVFYKNKKFDYRADGLIFATPTGSTAYSLSAGGPVIDPEMKCILFTQICPHSAFSKSTIFSKDSEILIQANSERKSKFLLNIDGNNCYKLTENQTIKVKLSELQANLIYFEEQNFCDTFFKKIYLF